jgi:hypothetical protein
MNKKTKSRTASQCQRILALLRERGETGAANYELSQIALCYGKRIGELYERGYVIEKEKGSHGIVWYKLVKEPAKEKKSHPKAVDVLKKYIEDFGGKVDAEELDILLEELNLQVRYKPGHFREEAKRGA